MADPLTLVTGIFGVAAAGLKLATGLYEILDHYDGAFDTIESIASDLSFFAVVLEDLEELGGLLNVPAPRNIASDRLVGSIGDIMEKCKLLFKDTNRMIFKTNGNRRSKISQSIGWIFRENKVKSIKATLDSLKYTLGLMLQTLKLKKASNKNIEKETAVLKSLLITQQHSLRRLKRVEDENQVTVKCQASIAPPLISPPLVEVKADTDSYRRYPSPYITLDTSAPQDETLISTVLRRAVPYLKKTVPDTPRDSNGKISTYSQSTSALGFVAPAQSDNIKFLLEHWTRDMDESRDTLPLPKRQAKISQYSMPTLGSETKAGNAAIEAMEAVILSLKVSVAQRIESNQDQLEAFEAKAKQRIVDNHRAIDAEREEIRVAHDTALHGLENQIFVRESKEATVSSLTREVERSKEELKRRYAERAVELSDPVTLHVKRLEERLKTELSEVATIKQNLARLREKEQEEYESNLLGLEKKTMVADDVTEQEKAAQKKLFEDCRKLEGFFDENFETEMMGVKDRWLALIRKMGWVLLDLKSDESQTKTSRPNPLDVPEWMDEDIEELASTKDEQEEEEDMAHRASDKILVDPEIPDILYSSDKIPVDSEQTKPAESSDKILDSSTKESSFPADHEGNEIQGGVIGVASRCWRQAWKPAQPCESGFNTISAVLRLNTERLWFKASRDEYWFFLGARKEPFYTIELVPADLRTYQTSAFEWTVLQKAWASAEALTASGYTYNEDSDGNFWIRKELTWSQIEHLFEISCAFLDSMMAAASRKVMAQRSEEDGELLRSPQNPRPRVFPRLRRSRDSKEVDIYSEFHGTFFRQQAGPLSS